MERKSSRTGNPNAEVDLAEKYVHGDRRFRNYTKARELCEKNLNKHKSSAAVEKANEILGDIYSKGLDVTKDGQKAIGHYEKAIGVFNELEIRNKIGEVYLYGMGIEQDYKKAKDIFEEIYADKSKDIYCAVAANNLGKVYYNENAYTNEDLAMFYFEQAAKGGMQDVLNDLIDYYIKKDEKKGVELLELKARTYFPERKRYYQEVFLKYDKKLVADFERDDQFQAIRRLAYIYDSKDSKAERFKALGYYERIAADYYDLLGVQQDKWCKALCALRKEYVGSSLWLDYTSKNTKRSAKAIKTCKCY